MKRGAANAVKVAAGIVVVVAAAGGGYWLGKKDTGASGPGAATVAAITEGSAPGRVAETLIEGKSTLGTAATGRNS